MGGNYMQGYFDIHSHILPGIDDGSDNMDETLRMLYIAYEEGIRIIVATPHYRAGKNSTPPNRLWDLFHEVSHAITDAGIDLHIILGQELLFHVDLVGELNRGEALTIDQTRYILVEFQPSASFNDLWKGLNHCIFAGYIPILAHTERYGCLIRDPYLVGELIDLGVYIQLNLSSINGKLIDPKVKFCHKLLKNEWVHFLGTDAHGAYNRAPMAKAEVEYIKKKYGDHVVRKLLWDNPMTMLEDKHLN